MTQFFTLEQANRALIFVEPILKDIQKSWKALASLEHEHAEDPARVKSLYQKIENCLQELRQVGCLCKDIEKGIVDFPIHYQGEVVLLCWKLGEDGIRHWHSMEEGLKDRHEIDEVFLKNLHKHPSSSLAS